MEIINGVSSDVISSGPIYDCMDGCSSYCPCLSLCYAEGICNLCAVDIGICIINCFCAIAG